MRVIAEVRDRVVAKIAPKPQPERPGSMLVDAASGIIRPEEHPLNPGFDTPGGYVDQWNGHVRTDVRQTALERVNLAHLQADQLPPSEGEILHDRLSFLEERRDEASQVFRDTAGQTPKSDRRRMLRKASRDVRRARQEIDIVLGSEVNEEARAEREVRDSIGALRRLDEDFALSGDDDRVIFYALENLREDPVGVSNLFGDYVAQSNASKYLAELTLRDLFFQYTCRLRYYKPETAKDSDQDWLEATDAAKIQMQRLARVHGARYW